MMIGLVGPARSGKSSAASILVKEQGYYKMAFADSIRRGLFAALPFLKRDSLHENKDVGVPELGFQTGRSLLQTMGHEWGRGQHPDIWVKALEAEINLMRMDKRRIVIDDVRYPNEIEWIRKQGGKIIGIRRVIQQDSYPDWMDHASENSMDENLADEWIINNEGLDDLQVLVDSVYQELYDPYVML